jgi:ADP-heptose:LPS heptosyltransferase
MIRLRFPVSGFRFRLSAFRLPPSAFRFSLFAGVFYLVNFSSMSKIGQRSAFIALLARHGAAFGYVVAVVLPVILRTGRRPVIFSRGMGMGDILCTFPAVQQLKLRHPGATTLYNCHASFAEVPRLARIADRITTSDAIGLVGYWYRWLLAGFYHFAHGDDRPESGCQEPMVVEFCRQFSLPVVAEHPKISAGAAATARAQAILKQKGLALDSLILIHPGPSWPVREWPVACWEQLLAGLRKQGYTNIGQLGVGRYLDFGRVTVPVVPGAVSLLDAFNIEECFAAIASAQLFIGIDSGLLHIAACTRTPAVGIFGMTFPEYRFAENYRRHFVTHRVDCAGCEHRKPRLHWRTGCPHEIKCMQSLPVEAVLRACLLQLASPP